MADGAAGARQPAPRYLLSGTSWTHRAAVRIPVDAEAGDPAG